MSHLSNEILYRLAGLVTWEMGFGQQDVEHMTHIRTCERCYRKLCAAMSMMEAIDEFGFAEAPAAEQVRRDSPRIAARKKEIARVEIALTVDRFCAELEVVSATGGWAFARPAALGGSGSRMVLCPPTRLEDMSDCNTFVEVDPRDQRLVIRLSESLSAQEPRAFLILPDGEKQLVGLGGSSRAGAKLPSLPEGKYRLILEK